MKTFREFVNESATVSGQVRSIEEAATRITTGAEGEEYSFGSGVITLAAVEKTRSNTTILFFDVDRPSSGQFEVEAKKGKVVAVRFWKDGNADPVDRKDLIPEFNRRGIITDILG